MYVWITLLFRRNLHVINQPYFNKTNVLNDLKRTLKTNGDFGGKQLGGSCQLSTADLGLLGLILLKKDSKIQEFPGGSVGKGSSIVPAVLRVWSLAQGLPCMCQGCADQKKVSKILSKSLCLRGEESPLRRHQNDAGLMIVADLANCGMSIVVFCSSFPQIYILFASTLWLEKFCYSGIPALNLISGSGKRIKSFCGCCCWKFISLPTLFHSLEREKKHTIRTDSSQPQLCPWPPLWTLIAPLDFSVFIFERRVVAWIMSRGTSVSIFSGELWLRASGTSWEAPIACVWPLSLWIKGRCAWLARTISSSEELLDKESLRSGQRMSSNYQWPQGAHGACR